MSIVYVALELSGLIIVTPSNGSCPWARAIQAREASVVRITRGISKLLSANGVVPVGRLSVGPSRYRAVAGTLAPIIPKEETENSSRNPQPGVPSCCGSSVLWDGGPSAGDARTLARLCPDRTIIYAAYDDPDDEHYEDLKRMEQELMQFPDYRLLPLPWPSAKTDASGARLPATYANYLVINGAVLVPTYNDPMDSRALDVVQKAFPDREIIGIDCSTLILQHGSLHCVTMQIPRGVL